VSDFQLTMSCDLMHVYYMLYVGLPRSLQSIAIMNCVGI